MNMSGKLRLNVLGSSAGNVSAERNSSGYLLTIDGSSVLFDCGSGICSAVKRLGVDPLSVQHVFVTHTHSDHTAELSLFVQMRYVTKEPGTLEIWMPEEAVEPFRKWLDTCYLFREKLSFNLILNPVANSIISLDKPKARIVPIPNRHFQDEAELIEKYNYPNKMQSFSYRFETDEKDILYSGDLWSLEDIEPHLKKLDLLIVESMHIDLATLPEMVEKYRIGKVLLTHIADPERARISEFAESAGAERFLVAEDGLELDI